MKREKKMDRNEHNYTIKLFDNDEECEIDTYLLYYYKNNHITGISHLSNEKLEKFFASIMVDICNLTQRNILSREKITKYFLELYEGKRNVKA
jgi:hypothetical protein